MDNRFAYLDTYAKKAVDAERAFHSSLIGSKEGAITSARRRPNPSMAQMLNDSSTGFHTALDQRSALLYAACSSVVALSLTEATRIVGSLMGDETTELSRYAMGFTLDRLRRDAESRVSQFQLDMKRISILSRSMRSEHAWDSSAALLRARESVDSKSSVSLDSIGRRQRTERFTRLLVRGLGLSVLVDSVVSASDREHFEVVTFEGEVVDVLHVDDYQDRRDDLFHPQARRFLRPTGK